LTLLGRRVPVGLKVFLTALAIVDDLGAVLVIAVFYSSKISLLNLALGAAVLAVMFGMARLGVRNPVAYAVFGIGGVWLAFLLSGVHATIAGVLAACTIPATVRIRRARFADELKEAVDRLRTKGGNEAGMLSHDEQETVAAIEHACEGVQPPLQRLEHRLYPIVMYFIMPVFALANAGVAFSPSSLQGPGFSVALGIVVGLVAGKFLGVAGFSFLAIRLRLADLPSATTWRHLLGAGLLAGVGFTMSLFVSGLAFQSGPLGDAAKLGILAGSLVSGVAGAIVLLRSPPAE
ncbi:MAG: Na+/H+ antiporter NhaA, partial [Phycisphaerae bacterium]|nr:Na+/H+ antiporter NhaA [Phycisphaerae bacterium]